MRTRGIRNFLSGLRSFPLQIALGWVLVLVPLLPFVQASLSVLLESGSVPSGAWTKIGWRMSMVRTAEVFLWVVGIGVIVGGFLSALLQIEGGGGRWAVVSLLLPAVLCSPYLWVVGVHGWRTLLPYSIQNWLDGKSGLIISCAIQNSAFVIFFSTLLAGWVSRSAIETCRIMGLWRLMFLQIGRRRWPMFLSLSMLGGMVSLSDAGGPQLMGFHTLASEIHIAFAGNDLARAFARVSGFGGLLFLTGSAVALLWFVVGRRQIRRLPPDDRRTGTFGSNRKRIGKIWIAAAAPSLLLLIGLCLPLLRTAGLGAQLRDAWFVLEESLLATVTTASASAVLILLLGFPLALAALQSRVLLAACGLIQLTLMACPPHAFAFGFRELVSLPGIAGGVDLISVVATGVNGGLRLVPLGAVAIAVWLRHVDPAWREAALSCRLGPRSYQFAVLIPSVWKGAVSLSVMLGLLALAEVSGAVILMPPGWASYPSRIFGLMDNALAAQVSAMCLYYWIMCLAISALLFLFHRIFSGYRGWSMES